MYLGTEITDARLPGKVSYVNSIIIRTVNRHRWGGREY